MSHVTLDHGRLRVVIDGRSGALREVLHQEAGISLIAQPEVAAQRPFMIIFADGTTEWTWRRCTIQAHGDEVRIWWDLERDLSLGVRLRLDATSDALDCTLHLANPAGVELAAVAYPYIAGIGRLGPAPDRDELIHAYATGFRVRNPLDHLPPVTVETEGQSPVLLGLYPEGFSGSTMQFMAYNAAGIGGFYVSTKDSSEREKWLNFYRHAAGDLRMTVWHTPATYAAARDIAPEYTTCLAAIDGGTWYDAADRYKSWALDQPWAAKGPLWSRDDRCRWLLEEVGLCTFGINARHDRASWLAEIDRIAGTPTLHVLGPNWSRIECNYKNRHPGGLADWFPATFHPRNVAVIRRNGDYLVPFQFDLLFGREESCSDRVAGTEALQIIPSPTFSRDAYDFRFLCPAAEFTRELHTARDRTLVEDYGVDGVYYDISVNNVRRICLSPTHGHEMGDTGAITQSYRELFSATAAAMSAVAGGASVPQGTELINEGMLPFVAFYQARAEASPAAPFEAGPFRELIKAGHADKIPLFAYVYHEYGPVRLDGWAKLSREQGDLVYFVLGRVFLQGGLIELNYEFSALEDLDGLQDTVGEHYYDFDDRHYAIDPELASFISRLARARIGPANRYLAYGAMQRPAPLEVVGDAELELDYFLYNCGTNMREYEDRGTLRVPAVLQTAWRYRDESAAWTLLNLAPEERRVRLTLEPPSLGENPSGWPARLSFPPDGARRSTDHPAPPFRLAVHIDQGPPQCLGILRGMRTVTVTLPPRTPLMLEALPITVDEEE